jgi:hypothetical protein
LTAAHPPTSPITTVGEPSGNWPGLTGTVMAASVSQPVLSATLNDLPIAPGSPARPAGLLLSDQMVVWHGK